jgi:hypothetical protein
MAARRLVGCSGRQEGHNFNQMQANGLGKSGFGLLWIKKGRRSGADRSGMGRGSPDLLQTTREADIAATTKRRRFKQFSLLARPELRKRTKGDRLRDRPERDLLRRMHVTDLTRELAKRVVEHLELSGFDESA